MAVGFALPRVSYAQFTVLAGASGFRPGRARPTCS